MLERRHRASPVLSAKIIKCHWAKFIRLGGLVPAVFSVRVQSVYWAGIEPDHPRSRRMTRWIGRAVLNLVKFNHHVFSLASGAQLLWQRVLQKKRSSTFSFKSHFLFFLSSSSSCLHLLSLLSFTSIFPSVTVSNRQFPKQDETKNFIFLIVGRIGVEENIWI